MAGVWALRCERLGGVSGMFLGFGVPYFNTFFLKEPLRNTSLYFFSPWLLKSPVFQASGSCLARSSLGFSLQREIRGCPSTQLRLLSYRPTCEPRPYRIVGYDPKIRGSNP